MRIFETEVWRGAPWGVSIISQSGQVSHLAGVSAAVCMTLHCTLIDLNIYVYIYIYLFLILWWITYIYLHFNLLRFLTLSATSVLHSGLQEFFIIWHQQLQHFEYKKKKKKILNLITVKVQNLEYLFVQCLPVTWIWFFKTCTWIIISKWVFFFSFLWFFSFWYFFFF